MVGQEPVRGSSISLVPHHRSASEIAPDRRRADQRGHARQVRQGGDGRSSALGLPIKQGSSLVLLQSYR